MKPPREVRVLDPQSPTQLVAFVHDLVDCTVFLDGRAERQCTDITCVELLPEFTDDPPVQLFFDHEIQTAMRERRKPVPAAVVHLDGTPFTPKGATIQ
jgi:hypothetical protein